MGLKLGANATLNRNSATYGSPTWSPVTIVTDVNQTQAWEKADATTRGNSRFKASEPTLLDLALSFKILEDHSDTNFVALRSAFTGATSIDVLCSTDAAATSGALTVRAVYKVFGFNKGEPLNGVNTYDVEIAPCYTTNVPVYATVA